MLVLTRKYQEKIRIGENITITVLRTKGKAVRLGIEAPADVPVIRGELTFATAVEAGETNAKSKVIDEPKVAIETRRRGTRALDASWTADSTVPVPGRSFEPVAPRVELHRVPRDRVAKILPGMVVGSAPLRAMLNQR